VTVTGFRIACNSPDCPSIFVLFSDERLPVEAFAIVVGNRMPAAGWTKDSHGNDSCPECSPRWPSGLCPGGLLTGERRATRGLEGARRLADIAPNRQ
jgi:hypothetical protein